MLLRVSPEMLRSLLVAHRTSAFGVFPRLHGIILGDESLYSMRGAETLLCAVRNVELHQIYVASGSVSEDCVAGSPARATLLMTEELHALASHCTHLRDLMISMPRTPSTPVPPNAAWWMRFTTTLLTASINYRSIRLTGIFSDEEVLRLAACEDLEDLTLVRPHSRNDPIFRMPVANDALGFGRLRRLEISDVSRTANLAVGLLHLIRPHSRLESCKIALNEPVHMELLQEVTMAASVHTSLIQLDMQVDLNESPSALRQMEVEGMNRLLSPLLDLRALRKLNIRMDPVVRAIPAELVLRGIQAWPALKTWKMGCHDGKIRTTCLLPLARFVDALRNHPQVRALPVVISCEEMPTCDLRAFEHQYGPQLHVDGDGQDSTVKAILNTIFPEAEIIYT
jgi:hypothetical protein